MTMEIYPYSEAELPDAVEILLQSLAAVYTENYATGLCLNGDLGAGKTTLVQALARQMGVTEVVTSPTFVVMKRYDTTHPIWHTLVHVDAYRIESESELKPLGWEKVLNEVGVLLCIEWPERIVNSLPEHAVTVTLTTVSPTQRQIVYG
jgi:tRNA threonylcarbamoyladenosine biosynthesis protein TsaE